MLRLRAKYCMLCQVDFGSLGRHFHFSFKYIAWPVCFADKPNSLGNRRVVTRDFSHSLGL